MPMDRTQLKKTLPDTIIELLKNAKLGEYFRYFYYGDPYVIPAANLPCVAVELVKTSYKQGPTGMDKILQTVEIKLYTNKQDEFNKPPEEVHGTRILEQYAQGLNTSTGEYDSHTVVGVLRKNFTLVNTAVGNDIDVDYGVSPRGNNQLLAEARITAVIEMLKPVSGRV